MTELVYKTSRFLFNKEVKNTNRLSKIILGFALINIVILLPDASDLFSTTGYIQAQINNAFIYKYDPLLNWILVPLQSCGVSNNIGLFIIVTSYILSLFLSLVNFKPFHFSLLAWVLHIMLVNSSYYFSYGADYFITFALFVNVTLNIKNIIPDEELTAIIESFTIRFVQIQLCFVYFFSGFGKLIGIDWLDGNAMWYVLNTYAPSIVKGALPSLADSPYLFMFLSLSVLLLELTYPILIFTKRLQKLCLAAVILMHIGIMFIMGLYTFGLVMIVLNFIAFGEYIKIDVSSKKDLIQRRVVPRLT